MNVLRIGLLSGLTGLVLSGSGHAQWLDNFDSYSVGPLAAQSQWELWNKADVGVSAANPFTPPHAARLTGDHQVLYDMANTPLRSRPRSGQWTLSVKTFISSSEVGNSFFRMWNDYPTDPNKSVDVGWDADQNTLTDKATRNTLPIRYDEWVTLFVCIDLDSDSYDLFYGDQLLAQNVAWSSRFGGAGKVEIAMVEMNSLSNFSVMHFDDIRLERTSGDCFVLVSEGNPATSGSSLTLTATSPSLGSGDLGAIFTWTVNGTPFINRILLTPFDAQGRFSITTTTPPGLAGLRLGLKAFAAPSTGPTMASNEDLLVIL